MKIVKFQGENRDWFWRLVADNGESIAIGGEGYRDERDCNRGINLVKAHMQGAEVFKQDVFGLSKDQGFAMASSRLGLLGSLGRQ